MGFDQELTQECSRFDSAGQGVHADCTIAEQEETHMGGEVEVRIRDSRLHVACESHDRRTEELPKAKGDVLDHLSMRQQECVGGNS